MIRLFLYFGLARWIREDVLQPDVMYQGCGGSPLQFNFKKKYRGYNSSNWSSFPKGWVILDVTYFIVHFAQDVAHVRTVIVIWIYAWDDSYPHCFRKGEILLRRWKCTLFIFNMNLAYLYYCTIDL